MKGHPFAFGVIVGIAGVWIYHHFVPGKGIGQPGQLGG
jgi:hypothetical protein